MNPQVTVLLPVYNGEKYLHDAVESILNQSFQDYELLIVDDGSTDTSPLIIDRFDDARIRVLHNRERLKLSGALNRGITEAKGAYIARMDADDISLPERLQCQADFLEQHSEIGLCGSWIEKFDQDTSYKSQYPNSSEQIKAYTLFDCPFAHPTVMFRKELFLKHDLMYDGSYYPTEDYELWARAIECFPAANLPRVLLKYRMHASSMTGADWQEMDSQAARVAENQLTKLGLSVSSEELRFHRNIGRGSSFSAGSMTELQKGETWLISLKDRNAEVKYYAEDAFREILSLIWFRFCMNSTWLGFDVLRCFYRSVLLKNSRENAQSMAILAASIVKSRVINSANR